MWLLIGTGAAVVLAISMWIVTAVNDFDSSACLTIAVLASMLVLGMSIFVAYFGFQWSASAYKATLINREYGTTYTQAEVFYAHDVIDTIR